MAATTKARSAAPPMATPAIPPVLRPLEPEDAASALEEGDDSAPVDGDDSELAVVVGLDTELEVSEDDTPSIVRLVYGSQSELGTANGHVGSWQSDRS